MNRTHWAEPAPVAVDEALRDAVGGHPLVAEILARRGFSDPAAAVAFLDSERYVPAPPEALPGIGRAATLLSEAIERGKTIAVWGDFDVDGQTATALLVDGLRGLGAEPLYYIPHRVDEGHGIKLPALQTLLDRGVDVLLTCDTGVTEHEAIDYARSRGVTVIVTDHHDLPPELPLVDALVEPKLLPAGHPLRELPGVGVAFKLMQALTARAGRGPAANRLLDLVALGIVADVARQVGDTRYLLQRGLRVLAATPRVGLQALMAQVGLDPARVDAETIGFQLGPRLNALGRLSDATRAVELLTTRDATAARILAAELEGLNNERKLLCDQVEAAAQEMLVQEPSLLDGEIILLVHPHWHAGVLGIVASRFVDQYGRPAALLTLTADGLARGSARGVPGVDLGAAIAANAQLLVRFGGHAGAAGLTVRPERIPELRRSLSNTIAATRTTVAGDTLNLDAVLPLGDVSLELAAELNRLAPFGEANRPVILASYGLSVVGHRLIGRTRRHRKLTLADDQGQRRDAVWWGGAEADLPEGTVDVAYTATAHDYRGEVSVQLVVQALRARGPVDLPAEPPTPLDVLDLRYAPDPYGEVRDLLAGSDVWQVWAEGNVPAELPTRGRHDLLPQIPLIVWSAPPGRRELEQAMRRVSPSQIVLVNLATAADRLETFLRTLLGTVKFALTRREGYLDVSAVAAALGQREVTVRRGLTWFELDGKIEIVTWITGNRVRVRAGRGVSGAVHDLALAQAELHALLAEAAAFRAFCRRAPVDGILPQEEP